MFGDNKQEETAEAGVDFADTACFVSRYDEDPKMKKKVKIELYRQ